MRENIEYKNCLKCGGIESIKIHFKELKESFEMKISKCTKCQYQYGIKEFSNSQSRVDMYNGGFELNDWNHFHDVVLDAIGKNLKHINDYLAFFDSLPEKIKMEAYKHGLSDTTVRDNIYVYLKKIFKD